MPAHHDRTPDPSATRAASATHLVIAGLGHVGLALAHDAVAAGFRVTCMGPDAPWIGRLIADLVIDDAMSAVLHDAVERGALRLVEAAEFCAGFDVAVLTGGSRAVDPAGPGPVELAAAALAPNLRRGALVVVAGCAGLRADGELVTATFELLTGLRAGHHFGLGYGIVHPATAAGVPRATIVSADDTTALHRTDAFFRRLGRDTAQVTPVEAAEFVAQLQHALARIEPGIRRVPGEPA